jgi:hypothetical protein
MWDAIDEQVRLEVALATLARCCRPAAWRAWLARWRPERQPAVEAVCCASATC